MLTFELTSSTNHIRHADAVLCATGLRFRARDAIPHLQPQRSARFCWGSSDLLPYFGSYLQPHVVTSWRLPTVKPKLTSEVPDPVIQTREWTKEVTSDNARRKRTLNSFPKLDDLFPTALLHQRAHHVWDVELETSMSCIWRHVWRF